MGFLLFSSLIPVTELNLCERIQAYELLMILTRNRSWKLKRRSAYNGKPKRDWILKEDKSSPTVANKSLMLTCDINAFEQRETISSDVPNVYPNRFSDQRSLRASDDDDLQAIGRLDDQIGSCSIQKLRANWKWTKSNIPSDIESNICNAWGVIYVV